MKLVPPLDPHRVVSGKEPPDPNPDSLRHD